MWLLFCIKILGVVSFLGNEAFNFSIADRSNELSKKYPILRLSGMGGGGEYVPMDYFRGNISH